MSHVDDDYADIIRTAFFRGRLDEDEELTAHLAACPSCQAVLTAAGFERDAARREAATMADDITAYVTHMADRETSRRILAAMARSEAFVAEVESMRQRWAQGSHAPPRRRSNAPVYVLTALAGVLALFFGSQYWRTNRTTEVESPTLVARGGMTHFEVLLQRGEERPRVCPPASDGRRCNWKPAQEKIWFRYRLEEQSPLDRMFVYGIDAQGVLIDMHPRQDASGHIRWTEATSDPVRCESRGCFPQTPAGAPEGVPPGPVVVVALFWSSTKDVSEVHHVLLDAVAP